MISKKIYLGLLFIAMMLIGCGNLDEAKLNSNEGCVLECGCH